MATPIQIPEALITEAPYEIWNAFVSIAILPLDELDFVQSIGHYAFWYESELHSGGHLQYFANHGTAHQSQVIEALKIIGADCQASILAKSVQQWNTIPNRQLDSSSEYIDAALSGEFDEFDSLFYSCSPTITQSLEHFLAENERFFINRI